MSNKTRFAFMRKSALLLLGLVFFFTLSPVAGLVFYVAVASIAFHSVMKQELGPGTRLVFSACWPTLLFAALLYFVADWIWEAFQ